MAANSGTVDGSSQGNHRVIRGFGGALINMAREARVSASGFFWVR
jgi:hypothetical protein